MKQIMILTVMTMMFVGVSQASLIACIVSPAPNMNQEGVPICNNMLGLGNEIILPAASFVATVYWEDLNGNGYTCSPSHLPGDCDYNDAKVMLVGDYGTKTLTLSYVGGMAMYLNTVGVEGAAVNRDVVGPNSVEIPWVVGTEIAMYDIPTYDGSFMGVWESGVGGRNVDGYPHAIVDMVVDAPSVPEPSTVWELGIGLVMLFGTRIARVYRFATKVA